MTGEMDIFELLQAISAIVEQRCHRFLARRRLTVPQYRLLLAVATGAAPTLGALADDLFCSRGNLTGVADRLERDGWLVRRRHEDDRRVVSLDLTEQGQRIHNIHQELTDHLAEAVCRWSTDELGLLVSLLRRVMEQGYGLAKAG